MLENDLKPKLPMYKTKVKLLPTLNLLQMTHQNHCPPVCILRMIAPMLLVRLSLKVSPNLRLFQGSPKETTVTKEELPLKVENMDFDLCVIIDLLRTMDYINQ